MDTISPFLRHLRAIYRSQNSYHNFKHALDVLQAAHLFLCDAGVVPPVSIVQDPDRLWKRSSTSRRKRYSKGSFKDPGILRILTSADLLALYIAAIGHDVGHPGLSNAFMVYPSNLCCYLRVLLTFASRKMLRLPCLLSTRTVRPWSKCIDLSSCTSCDDGAWNTCTPPRSRECSTVSYSPPI
jgi:hypothetical protein